MSQTQQRFAITGASGFIGRALCRFELVRGLDIIALTRLPITVPTGIQNIVLGIDNLVDFILSCCEHPGAAGEPFLISDGEDIATPDLLIRLGAATDATVKMFPLLVGVLKFAAMTLGQRPIFDKLCGSLQVDISKGYQKLGLQAPIALITVCIQ